jgi:hypothetical protein
VVLLSTFSLPALDELWPFNSVRRFSPCSKSSTMSGENPAKG